MTKWFVVEGDECILTDSIIGVGSIKKVKTSSGKGQDLVEKTIYNFTLRLGTGGVIVKSLDYPDFDVAQGFRNDLLA